MLPKVDVMQKLGGLPLFGTWLLGVRGVWGLVRLARTEPANASLLSGGTLTMDRLSWD